MSAPAVERARPRKLIPLSELPDRFCVYRECGKLLVRREGEPGDKWRARTSCGDECSRKARRTPEGPTRYCPAPGCGKALVRREGESRFQFMRRTTCGREAGCTTAKARGHRAPAQPRPSKPRWKLGPVHGPELPPGIRPPWRPVGFPPEVPPEVLRPRGVD